MASWLHNFTPDLPCLNDEYDFVIVGSGLTAVSFVHRLTKLSRNKRILVIEAGLPRLSEHFQQETEDAAWTAFQEVADEEIGAGLPSLVPHRILFGGRTLFWTAWTPRPTIEELDRWPKKLVTTLLSEFQEAEEFLGTDRADTTSMPGDKFPWSAVSGYSINPASIARRNGVKFSAVSVWREIFSSGKNIINIVCGARVSELLAEEQQITGLKFGDVEKHFSGAQFVLCAGALENFRLSNRLGNVTHSIACHGVVSHVITGRLLEPTKRPTAMGAMLARPNRNEGPFDHHFQICLASLAPGWTADQVHRMSPDALELSAKILPKTADFACTITCLFEFPSLQQKTDDQLSGSSGFAASAESRGVDNPALFAEALSAQFTYFQDRTKDFAERFLDFEALENQSVQTQTVAKYVVHDTLINSEVTDLEVKSWRQIHGMCGNCFTLGQINWPSIGVSNPAILNVAAAFALANELA
ncbi:hypothetical protein DSM25558_4491 [Agrobacterium sp. DSM 25558]|uniref:GMC family oxidoreductase n=1 Tax=Agrobacterium sp. DSM 25558 TaxID=1907665 RepID=UPI0009725387|nr:GMC family oxidoreductase [Agrobacterium sp. DSM 25558]SCX28501.1 hypothetical protein DSM25558_4491 [Agrobacterium sp. DSM 25558]